MGFMIASFPVLASSIIKVKKEKEVTREGDFSFFSYIVMALSGTIRFP